MYLRVSAFRAWRAHAALSLGHPTTLNQLRWGSAPIVCTPYSRVHAMHCSVQPMWQQGRGSKSGTITKPSQQLPHQQGPLYCICITFVVLVVWLRALEEPAGAEPAVCIVYDREGQTMPHCSPFR